MNEWASAQQRPATSMTETTTTEMRNEADDDSPEEGRPSPRLFHE